MSAAEAGPAEGVGDAERGRGRDARCVVKAVVRQAVLEIVAPSGPGGRAAGEDGAAFL